MQQLQQLLLQQPSNYAALAQLLGLLRRVGRVEEGQPFLHTAQQHVSRTAGTAGDEFCHHMAALQIVLASVVLFFTL